MQDKNFLEFRIIIWNMIKYLFSGIGILVIQYLYKYFRYKSKKNNLIKLYNKINFWYSEINSNLDSNLNMNKIKHIEEDITDFISMKKLSYYKLNFTPNFRKAFLKFCGIKKSMRGNKKLFEKYSRLPYQGIDIESLWFMLMGNFFIFYNEYKNAKEGKNKFRNQKYSKNWADIQMPLKALKMYFNYGDHIEKFDNI